MGLNRCPDRNPAARCAISALAAASVLVRTLAANADLPPIQWHAPPSCGTAAELTMEISRLLRADTSDVIHERFVADVVEESVGRWRLRLQGVTRSGSWTRTLTGASCIELRDATKVMIALAIAPTHASAIIEQSAVPGSIAIGTSNPATPTIAVPDAIPVPPGGLSTGPSASAPPSNTTSAVSGATIPPSPKPGPMVLPGRAPSLTAATTTAPTQSAAGVTAPRKTKEAEALREQSPRAASRPTVSTPSSGTALLARTGIAAGVLPSPTVLLALGAMHGFAQLQLTGYFGWLLAQTGYSNDDPTKGASVQLGYAAAEIGYAWLEQPMQLGLHASLQGGVMAAASTGVHGGKSGYGPYSSVGAGISLAYPAESRWAALLSADGWVNCIAPNFQISELGRVYQPGLFGGVFGLGLRARLK